MCRSHQLLPGVQRGFAHHRLAAALAGVCGLATGLHAQTTYTETEPNDSRATANGPFVMASGDMITGTSTGQATGGGTNSIDWFQIQPTLASPGIYRHTLVLTSATLTQRFQIKGRGQFDSQPSSADASTCFDAASGAGIALHTVGWYSFGGATPVYVALFGASTSTQPYTLTLTTTPVTPTDLGTMPGGYVTVSSVGETAADTDFWVYDANLNPVPGFGNDDMPDVNAHTVLQSVASKDLLSPGVYYVAISDYNLANDQLSPVGDRYPSKAYYDYPGVVTQMGVSNSAQNVNVGFKVVDGLGVEHHVPATKVNSYDVLWFKFTVTAPATGACCKPDGTCTVASQNGCTALSGTYQGNGSSCGSVTCTQPPPGACCQLDGTCISASSYACTQYSGAWGGAGSSCATQSCFATLDASTLTQNGAGGLSGAGGEFLDLTASGGHDVIVKRIDYYGTQSYNNATPLPVIDVYVRLTGTYQGFQFGATNTQTPPPNDWQLNTTVTTTPYPVGSSFTALPIVLATPVTVPAGQTVGVYLVPRAAGIKAPSSGPFQFSNSDLSLYSFDARSFVAASAPGWATTLLGGQHAFAGRVFYTNVPACYANCDGSTQVPVLNVADFTCFLQKYAAADPYANCDASTSPPVLNVADFTCFLQKYAAGCS